VSSYSLVVNGTVVQTVTANQAAVSASLNWTVPAGAAAGNSYTVQISAVNTGGHVGYASLGLVVAGSTALTGTVSLGSSYAGHSLVLGAGTYTVPAALSLNSLTLMSGALVVGVAGQPLGLTVAGALKVQCGSRLDLTAYGYAGAPATRATCPGWRRREWSRRASTPAAATAAWASSGATSAGRLWARRSTASTCRSRAAAAAR